MEVDSMEWGQRLLCELVNGLAGQGAHIKCVEALRRFSNTAREDARAREMLEDALQKAAQLSQKVEAAAPFYRAMYLEGDSRPSAKEIGRRFYVDKRSVFRYVNTVLEALAVLFFGVVGVDWLEMSVERKG